MISKKNVFIVTPIVLLKKKNSRGDNDFNVKIVIRIFKAKEENQGFKQNYGMNMFGRNKLFQI